MVPTTKNTANKEETPLLFNHAKDGKQIIAIKIDRNKGFKIGAAAFILAIIIQIAASEIRIGRHLEDIGRPLID